MLSKNARENLKSFCVTAKDTLQKKHSMIKLHQNNILELESNMHEKILLHDGSNTQEDAFARRRFCTKGNFCTKTLLHRFKSLSFFFYS